LTIAAVAPTIPPNPDANDDDEDVRRRGSAPDLRFRLRKTGRSSSCELGRPQRLGGASGLRCGRRHER
jgi:hypothetical protein